MVPVRDGQETAHEVALSDGRVIRVLPDPDYSGLKRSQTILRALTALDAIWRADAEGESVFSLQDDSGRPVVDQLAVLAGYLGDLPWEIVGTDDGCEHPALEVGTFDRDGLAAYVSVVCPACGQKWGGLVEPLAISIKEVW
jgi:hypothetical protein